MSFTLSIFIIFAVADAQNLGAWQRVSYSPLIEGRYQPACAYFPGSTSEFIVVGGFDASTYFSDLNSISLSGSGSAQKNEQLVGTTSLGARFGMAYTADPSGGDLYVHGGNLNGLGMKLIFKIQNLIVKYISVRIIIVYR